MFLRHFVQISREKKIITYRKLYGGYERANYMKPLRNIFIMAVLVNLILMATADARPHRHGAVVHIGIGYNYPHHYGHGYWYPPPFYYGGYPYYYGGYPYWGGDYYPDVIVERPVVVVRETATPAQVYRVPAVPDEETLSLFASIRSKKAELLRQLQSADKAEKIKAIAELAGLTYDDQVREKLKDILLKDTDPDLRKEVANAFGKSKNDTLVSILEEVRVGDDNKEVRQAADQAIKNIKGISN
jgi:hypothetical protein